MCPSIPPAELCGVAYTDISVCVAILKKNATYHEGVASNLLLRWIVCLFVCLNRTCIVVYLERTTFRQVSQEIVEQRVPFGAHEQPALAFVET